MTALLDPKTVQAAIDDLAAGKRDQAMYDTVLAAAQEYAYRLNNPESVLSQGGLLLDTLIILPRLNSGALRKIADEAQRIIDARMEDGIPD